MPELTDTEVIEKLTRLNVSHSSDGTRAPHKPLTVLLALGRVAHSKPRFMSYIENRKKGEQLIRNFGPQAKKTNRFANPFARLRNDNDMWELKNTEEINEKNTPIHVDKTLKNHNVHAGFVQPIYNKLCDNHDLILKTAQTLLNKEFPESMHDDILKAVGLDQLITEHIEVPRIARDPDFRNKVLLAYESRCAICDYYLRLDDAILGVEAAHIQWHAYKGPSEVHNGLALCTGHHKAFDRGAIGIDINMKVLVSKHLTGDRQTITQHFRQYKDKKIHLPYEKEEHPAPKYLQWHREQVFKG